MPVPLSLQDGFDAATDEVDEVGDEGIISGLSAWTTRKLETYSLYPWMLKWSYNMPNPAQAKDKIANIKIKKKKNLFEKDVAVSHYRKRNMGLSALSNTHSGWTTLLLP